MGVTGLWTVLHPCARPIKLETLNKKRLAIDASIWIYQFLKAVRDKEGNQLRNSHIVGFFRRICKLLFVGIKPVFVFDGGAPALKRQTISGRKRRREGRREDAAKTAGKLLALQLQRLAEEEEAKARNGQDVFDADEGPLPDNLVYVDEITMSPAERQQNRKFRKQDAYHLPELDVSMAEMGQPNDPRVMNLEELQHYANQFNTGEDINVYDFSKIDFDSSFFQSLPPSDQYNILNAARLRSRLRMGYSKDQLDKMFPDRMAFSKFQIERVRERNMLTQRLMRLQGMSVDGTLSMDGSTRVAGEKGREYVLVKNDGVEGGWALGVVNTTGRKEQPIDVDKIDKPMMWDESSSDEEQFEDVPIEGLNRLPKRSDKPANMATSIMSRNNGRRRDFYSARGRTLGTRKPKAAESDSLFVEQSSDEDEDWEDLTTQNDEDEDTDLQRAIALSLQQDHQESDEPQLEQHSEEQPVFQRQRKVEESRPFFAGSGMSIAKAANARAIKASKPVQQPFEDDEDDEDDDDLDFQAALKNSRRQKTEIVSAKPAEQDAPRHFPGFDGPLPFEKLDLGQSLFSKKKEQVKATEDNAGGFVVDDPDKDKKKSSKPLPPWFSSVSKGPISVDEDDDMGAPVVDDDDDEGFVFENQRKSAKSAPIEVIDLEIQDSIPEIIDVDAVETQATTSTAPFLELNEQSTEHPVTPSSAGQVDMHKRIQGFESGGLLQDGATNAKENTGDEDDEMEWEEVDVASKPTKPTIAPETQDDIIDSEPAPYEAGIVENVHSLDIEPNNAAPVKHEDEDEFNYSDPEEEELFRQIAQEEEENLRFASSLNNRSITDNIADFEAEMKKLRNQQKKDLRDADEVTQTMINECQQLLSLFGLPYITAPMEAEAQCAELVHLGLVDGVVTDDSDIFLFGGTRVYKNMFNQAKFVECYLANDLETEFGLSRQRLISIAQLLGSDYVEGLPSVGPVTALEILSEFDTLENFKAWYTSVQNGTRTKADDAMFPIRQKFRRNSKKVFLPTSFPDARVDEAYLHPEVDSDPSEFVWGVPDLAALRVFLMTTIGWSEQRTDEILVPVIRDMNQRQTEGTQANITSFFSGNVGAGAFAPRRRGEGGSKRLHSALQRMGERSHAMAHDDIPLVNTVTEASLSKASRDQDGDYEQDAPTKKRTKRTKKN